MNNFKYKFYINETPYTVFIDTSTDDYKKIVINNKELVNEKYICGFAGNSNLIYYPIDIKEHELIVSVDCYAINHTYNIYLDDVSLLDQTRLSSTLTQAEQTIKRGFSALFYGSWPAKILPSIGLTATYIIIKSLFIGFFEPKLLLLFLLVPPIIFLLILGEWLESKNIIKRFRKRFRPRTKF